MIVAGKVEAAVCDGFDERSPTANLKLGITSGMSPVASQFADAFLTSIVLALWAMAGSALWGCLLFFLGSNTNRAFSIAVGAYVQLLRNVPVLLPIYLLYFGLPMVGLFWSAAVCGVLAIILQQGAYISEILRGGANAIDRAMLDASTSIGLTRWKTFRMIIMPQVLANSLPALGNQAALLFKDTSLLSAIAVVEVMLQAKLLVESSGSIYQPFLIAWGLYLAAITVIDLAFAGLRSRIRWRS